MAFSPSSSSSSSSSSTAKAKSKAKASSETPSPPSSTAATNIPAHVLDHLLDLLVGCGDLPPSFHTTATADPSLVTEDYLVAKLQSTLDARGHIPVHQLAALLQVNQQTADHILDLVLSGAQGSVLLVDSFVVTQAGYKGLEHQLVDLITERGGVANADTLASATGTSTGLVYLMLDKPHLFNAVHRDSIDTSVYYSSFFANKLAAQLADTLSNATEPTNIKPILMSTGCPAGLWQSTLHALMPTLAGRVSNLLYTPTAYLTKQLDQFRSLLSTAGYIPLATIPPGVLSQLLAPSASSDMDSRPPWSLASVLISASHATALKDTIKALAQEAAGDGPVEDVIVDVTGQAGSVLDPADAIAFVNQAFGPSSSTTHYLTSGSKLASRPLLVRASLRLAIDPIVAHVLASVPAGTAPPANGASAAQVTRAMVAKHLTPLPARMRDDLMPLLLVHVQAAVDAALVYRSDPPLALAYWLARLRVYAEGLSALGVPKPYGKALERGMLRRVGRPLRDALVALIVPGAGPGGEDEVDQVKALVTQAVEVKSAAVVRKVVETVAKAHGIAMPGDEEVLAEKRAMREEIVRMADEWREVAGGKTVKSGESVEEAEDLDDRPGIQWWRVAERLVLEKDLVVWLDASLPEDVVLVLLDKAFG